MGGSEGVLEGVLEGGLVGVLDSMSPVATM